MNHFDVIYYINLDERTDRKELLIEELLKYGVNPEKIIRIPAIKHKIPYVGCSKSHQKALEEFEKSTHNNCLILEDDFTFKESEAITKFTLDKFFQNNIAWDVLMLSAFDRQVKISTITGLYKAIEVQTASGYAVNKSFLPILKANVDEGVQLLELHDEGKYCIDQYWKKLQPQYNWYVMKPKLGYQRDNYSNIEQKMVSYPDKYDTTFPYNYKYIMGVLCCHQNLPQAEKQYREQLSNIHQYPIIYLKFIGNQDLSTPWLYNEKENLLIIRCQDDYVNLPNKVYQFLKITKQLFPNMVGVFKTDEDITINLHNLYQYLEKNQHLPYFGRYVNGDSHYSRYLANKEYVTNVYPEFKNIPVRVEFAPYCAGGGYYINQQCVNVILQNEEYFKPFPKDTYKEYFVNKMERVLKEQAIEKAYFKDLHVFEDKTIGLVLHKHNITPQDKRTELIQAINWDGI